MSRVSKELEHQGPVVMVNLMRFRARSLDGDGSGWDAYLRYSALTVPMIKARGGTLLWTGDAKAVALGAQDGNQWDYLALVYYPDVAAFIDMMTSADYETELRPASPQRLRGARDHRTRRRTASSRWGRAVARHGAKRDPGPAAPACAKVLGLSLRCSSGLPSMRL